MLWQRAWVRTDAATGRPGIAAFPAGVSPLKLAEADALLHLLRATRPEHTDKFPSRPRLSRTQVMYIEAKPGLTGPARIGRVAFSKTGKTLYYRGRTFHSLKGSGYKANYQDAQTLTWHWISRCRRDGQDTLYPGIVEIDEDVREEYWLTIRNLPAKVNVTSFRSEGKYSRRRPEPEKPNHPATGSRSGSACSARR